MKKTLTSLVCSISLLAQSATYYVDYDGGDDSNSGTSTGSPWKHSPFDANATGNPDITTPVAGDTIQFKAGVRYKGQLTINSSGTAGNHITYKGTGWGTGKAILDGSVLLTNTWTQCTSSAQAYGNPNYANIWFATAAFTNQTGLNQIIQTNEQLRFSQITPVPHAVLFDLTTTWSNVPSANVTLTSLSNSTLFTQTDVDFWRGAYLALHKSPNIVSFEIIEILHQHHICPATGGDHAHFFGQTKMFGGVDRHHLDRCDRIQSLLNGVTQNTVHLTVVGQGPSMRVISDQHKAPRVHAEFRDRAHL